MLSSKKSWLEAQLAEQELLLTSLKTELAAFEGLYLRQVGILYAELDEWNAVLKINWDPAYRTGLRHQSDRGDSLSYLANGIDMMLA